MNGKSIKQIATELHISKQALWQRMKRHQQILDMMPEHSYIIKRSVFVDETLENSIKTLYNNGDGIKNVYDVNANDVDNVDDIVVNIGDDINIIEGIDGIKNINRTDNDNNVDDNIVNKNIKETNNINDIDGVDDNKVNNIDGNHDVDVNIVTANLQKIIDMQQQQLAIKDKQIDELTAMLKQAQEQQTILVQALNAAQALAAIGKQQFFLQATEQTNEQAENPEVPESTKKSFFQSRKTLVYAFYGYL